MQVHDITKYSNHNNINEIRNILANKKFDLVYGNTYSMTEIRKAVQEGHPAFVRLQKAEDEKIICIVGEDKHSFITAKDEDLFEVSDKSLKKAWTGDAVIVLGNQTVEQSKPCDPVNDFVIFCSERDNWDDLFNQIKNIGKDQILSVNKLCSCKLPSHPVIVIFKNPPDSFIKKGIRAANNGIEINIFDPSDPVTEFLHELGHIYYNTRLTDEEKKVFNDLHSKLNKNNLPAIFQANWDWEKGEEVFATVYFWFIKGEISHKGYRDILQVQYPDGFDAVSKIFDRVHDEIAVSQSLKAKQDRIEREWAENEKDFLFWMNNISNKSTKALIKGKGIVKSKIPSKFNKLLEIPLCLQKTDLGCYGNRKWIIVDSGLLKGYVIVLRNDKLDLDYMKSNQTYYLIPRMKNISSNNRNYKKVEYVTPDEILLKASEEKKLIQQSKMSKLNKFITSFQSQILGKIK